MDFLEGFLLGPVWSDTEYETRRHAGFYWFVGWLVLAAFVLLLLKPDSVPDILKLSVPLSIALFAVLVVLSPLINRFYYRLNVVVKIVALAILAAKYLFGMVAFLQFWQKRITIDLGAMPQILLDFANNMIASTTEYFQALGEGTGMLVGMIAGGLLIVLVFAGILLASTLLPAVYLYILKLIQLGIDYLYRTTLFPMIFGRGRA